MSKLPEGISLTTNNGAKITIVSVLGEGATGIAYLAEMEGEGKVVVKVARPGQNEFVEGERIILEKFRDKYRGKYSPVVELLGYGSTDSQSYIVMELLQGKPILEILEGEGRLEEKEAISIAKDLFEVFEYLHTEIKVTYPDLKFDNIRLEGEKGTRKLKIFDFGGLIDRDRTIAKPEQDVLMCASILYAVLKGDVIYVLGGEYERIPLDTGKEPSGDNDWLTVSWGTRRLVSKMLSPVSEIRIKTAKEALEETEWLVEQWEKIPAKLSNDSVNYSNQADVAKKNKQIVDENILRAKALAGFHILSKSPEKDDFAKQALEKVNGLYQGVSFMNLGKTDLKTGSYDTAIKHFLSGEVLESNPKIFRFWRRLAETMKEQKDSGLDYEAAEKLAEHFSEKRYIDAFNTVKDHVGEESLVALELLVYTGLHHGQEFQNQSGFQKAVAEYTKAQENLEKIRLRSETDYAFMRNLCGDPGFRIEECKRHLADGEFEEKYNSAKGELKNDFNNLNNLYKYAYFAVRQSDAKTVHLDVIELLDAALKKTDISIALKVAEVLYWRLPIKNDDIRHVYGSIGRLSNTFDIVTCNAGNEESLALLFDKKMSSAFCDFSGYWNKVYNLFNWGGVITISDEAFWEKMYKALGDAQSVVSKDEYGRLRDLFEKRLSDIKKSKESSQTGAVINKAGNNKKMIWVGGSIAFVLLMVMLIFVLPTLNPPAAPAPVASPTSSPIPVSPTITSSPTATPTNTPLPDSAYLLRDMSSLTPKLPIQADQLWLMPPFEQCAENSIDFCQSMDKALPAGKYAVFVYNDTKVTKSNFLMRAQVSLKEDPALLRLVLGLGEFQLGTVDEIYPIEPRPVSWILAGIYDLSQDGTVVVNITSLDPNKKIQPEDLKKIVLVKISEEVLNSIPGVEGNQIAQILDDTNLHNTSTTFFDVPLQISSAWNGGITSIEKGLVTGSSVMQPGIYSAYYHVVGEDFSPYRINVKIKAGPSIEIKSIEGYAINLPGSWQLLLGDFELTSPAQVMFEFSSGDGTPILLDAIIIYKKQ